MNTNLIIIKIENVDYSKLTSFLIKHSIFFKDMQVSENIVTLKINKENLKLIKEYYKSTKIVRYLGLNGLLAFLKKHAIILASFLLTYIILLILSNVIFDIKIITNNNELKRVITLYLKDYDIEKYKFMKSNKELDVIKEKILEENKTTLEWLEIERVGTTYVINLTERVINDPPAEDKKTDIVAKKDAQLMYIITKNGTKLKEINEIVKKGEVIITGNIIKNEEVIDTVEAKGEVFGEVWYTVNITVPYTHTEYESTGEVVNHIYMDFFGHKITLMGKYETAESLNETTTVLDKPYLFFKIMNEKKTLYKYVTHNLTEDEAYEEAVHRADKSINVKLSPEEYIIEKKVLKINKYSSKIELEIFYRVYENIGESQEIVVPLDTGGE